VKIKFKFILFFVPVFTFALVAVSALNVRLFEKDKVAYVFISTLETTKISSSLVATELVSQKPLFEILISAFDFANKKFPETSKSFLQTNSTLAYVSVEAVDGGVATKLDSLGAPPEEIAATLEKRAIDKTTTSPLFFEKRSDIWGLSHSFKVKGYTPENYRLTLVYRKNPFQELLSQARYFDMYLISKSGHVLAKPSTLVDKQTLNLVETKFKEIGAQGDLPTTREYVAPGADEKDSYLVAWAPAPDTDLGFVSITQKSKAMKAVEEMKTTSAGFLLLLLSVGLIAVLLLIKAITNNIETLTIALMKFSKGDLDTKSDIKSKDEIGLMSTVFNDMTDKIRDLVAASMSKARMEGELNTARVVQQNLVPATDFDSANVLVRGYFEPASECGGDWWFYLTHENKFWMMIADVTGHGVASALLTASLRAGVSALKEIPNLSLESYVEQLNRVINETGKGKLMATFFVSRTDLTTGHTDYVNASHWAPILLRAREGASEELFETRGGPRLGERADTEYKAGSVILEPGDVLFAFTDGLSEFANAEGREYGERRINKCLAKATGESSDLTAYREHMLTDFKNFQKDAALPDDLTFNFFQFFPSPVADEIGERKEAV
jgi:phosphoserine phosphatase RsbU/P